MAFVEDTIMDGYLVKKSQIVAVLVFLIYSIFPNILNLKYISVDEVFSRFYTVTNAEGGASFIAEGFWNFVYLSVIFFLI